MNGQRSKSLSLTNAGPPQTSILVDRQINFHNDIGNWSCACRILESAGYHVQACESSDPTVGDLALVQVEDVGHRSSIVITHTKKMRVYPDDMLAGVFGNRYATVATEAEVADTGKSVEAYDAE